MKITIVGGGNIGTQFAVHCAEKGHDVIVYTSEPGIFSKHLEIVDDCGRITHEGDIIYATNKPEHAFCNVDLVIVTLPPMLMEPIAELIFDYAEDQTIIGVVPGNGGSECAFKKCIEKGVVFFGIERVPAIARLIRKGQTVKSTGYRDELHVSALPIVNASKCAEMISRLFDIPSKVIPNFLNLTMTPSNPILHTARLKTLFGDWHDGITYDQVPLFYEDWDDESSYLLLACDQEVQNICKAFPEFDLSYVKSLRDHYNCQTPQELTKKISSIPAFKGIKTPTIESDNRLIPDLHSRYFTADFSYGLTIIKQVAGFAEVETPVINGILEWYEAISVEKKRFCFTDYGINTRCDFVRYYSK